MPFIHFFKGAYSIAFFFLFAIWHCLLLLAKACCCKVRINDNLIANPTFPRVSWTAPLYPCAKTPQFGNAKWTQSTAMKHLAVNNKGVIIPDLNSRLLMLRSWLCFLSRDAQSYAASCPRLINVTFPFPWAFPAPQCLSLQLLSHSLTLLSATYFVTRLHFFTCPYNILYAIVHTLRAKSL